MFGRFPRIQQDHFALDFISDTLRMMTMSLDDPHQVEDCMKQLDQEASPRGACRAPRAAEHGRRAAGARHRRGRAGHREDHEPYRTAGRDPGPDDRRGAGRHLPRRVPRLRLRRPDRRPAARTAYEQDGQFYAIIRDCLVGYLHGHSAPIAVELARSNVPSILQPSFHELDEVLAPCRPTRWPSERQHRDRMARKRPADDHQAAQRGRPSRPPRRRLEGRLRRLRHGDDGVLPDALAAQHVERGHAQGSRRIFHRCQRQ